MLYEQVRWQYLNRGRTLVKNNLTWSGIFKDASKRLEIA